jgi:hypothetical protein
MSQPSVGGGADHVLRALRDGERVRPSEATAFAQVSAWALVALAATFAGAALVLQSFRGGPPPGPVDWLCLVVCWVWALVRLISSGSARLREAVQLTSGCLIYWDWRGRRQQPGWDEVVELKRERETYFRRAYRDHLRVLCWSRDEPLIAVIEVSYLPWPHQVIEALQNEIVERAGLALVERAGFSGTTIWRRPELAEALRDETV